MCVFFLLSSHSRSSLVSVVFDFSDSLNDVAPVSPNSLSVDAKRNDKECIVDRCLLCVFFYSQLRLSFVSVVFDFNESLNDVAPMASMSLAVDMKKQ